MLGGRRWGRVKENGHIYSLKQRLSPIYTRINRTLNIHALKFLDISSSHPAKPLSTIPHRSFQSSLRPSIHIPDFPASPQYVNPFILGAAHCHRYHDCTRLSQPSSDSPAHATHAKEEGNNPTRKGADADCPGGVMTGYGLDLGSGPVPVPGHTDH